jgi:thiol-disulfide isomerase/thioredoxin
MISPVFGQLSEKYPNIVFVKIDVDVNQARAVVASLRE